MEDTKEVRLIEVTSLVPGMCPAQDVISSTGLMLLAAGQPLSVRTITRIRFYAFESLEILVDSIPAPETLSHEADSEISYYEKLHDTEEFMIYRSTFSACVHRFEQKLRAMLEEGGEPDKAGLLNCINELRACSNSGLQLFDLIHCVRSYEDITFAHSVNVALIASAIGSWLCFEEAAIDLLIQCAIYHDIGKLLIPKTVVEKPAALTPDEFNLMKTHTMRGYNVLRTKDLDPCIPRVAMLHHERCNGSGYPLGIKAEDIDEFTKIIAIADVYEAMTSPRVYRKPKSALDAIRVFETESGSLFDANILRVLITQLSRSYLNNKVMLNDGRVGLIVELHPESVSTPVIKFSDGQVIDLLTTPGLEIEYII